MQAGDSNSIFAVQCLFVSHSVFPLLTTSSLTYRRGRNIMIDKCFTNLVNYLGAILRRRDRQTGYMVTDLGEQKTESGRIPCFKGSAQRIVRT